MQANGLNSSNIKLDLKCQFFKQSKLNKYWYVLLMVDEYAGTTTIIVGLNNGLNSSNMKLDFDHQFFNLIKWKLMLACVVDGWWVIAGTIIILLLLMMIISLLLLLFSQF